MKLPLAGRVAGLVLAGLTGTALLAGCGGGSSPTAAPTADASGAASGIQAYLSCLTAHGVALPSRAPGARGTRSPGARPSFSRRPRPSGSAGAGGFGGGGGFGGAGGFGGGFGGLFNDPSNPPAGVSATTWSAALTACKSLQPTAANRGAGAGGFNNSQFTAYRNCLQSHGVTFSAGPNGLSTSDPKIAAALKTCAPLRPTGGGGRPSGAPTPAPSASG